MAHLHGLSTGHVGLNVTDLERSLQFYQNALGFKVLGRSDEDGRRYGFLGDGERLVLTLWQQSDGRFATASPGLHHLSFQAESIDAVRDAEARLRELGVKFAYDGIVAHGEGTKSGGIFFEDPDGIRLEIFSATGAESHHAATAGAPSCGFF